MSRSKTKIAVAIALLAAAGGLFWWQTPRSAALDRATFVCVETGKTFTMPLRSVPYFPAKNPDTGRETLVPVSSEANNKLGAGTVRYAYTKEGYFKWGHGAYVAKQVADRGNINDVYKVLNYFLGGEYRALQARDRGYAGPNMALGVEYAQKQGWAQDQIDALKATEAKLKRKFQKPFVSTTTPTNADAMEEDYRLRSAEARAAAQKLVAEAKAKAARATEKQLATADEKIAGTLAEAEAGIKAASQSALAEIEAVAADAAQDMVARISGVKASPAAARAAVKAALAHG